MNKDFAFLFKPGDYLRDTQCLSERAQVAYDRIMCEHMRNICITQQQLNFFTKRLTEDEKAELLMIVDKIDGGYEINWVAESIRERIAYSESRSKNRMGKSKKHMKTYVKHMEGDSDSKGYNELLSKVVSKNNIELPDGFEKLILEWLKYKSEKGQSYKETGLKTLINVFIKTSGGDKKIGREMLDYSMSKNYTGLYKEKNNAGNSGSNKIDPKRTNSYWD
ncbi:hypothetical protein [Sulfuricurvum sp. MLSB]|uniref:hypothetical protein n=1 Tax=Sulfuricurvum sp. MLSB TaxID=1537917 RepID=UPI0025FCEC45|nr:hypothetical protein [Sulfuricurvum sp. MLSB]